MTPNFKQLLTIYIFELFWAHYKGKFTFTISNVSKYFDKFFLDTIKVKIFKNKVVRIRTIFILEKWILKIIKIDNMKIIQNIKKYFQNFFHE